jgi:hypothetical protein
MPWPSLGESIKKWPKLWKKPENKWPLEGTMTSWVMNLFMVNYGARDSSHTDGSHQDSSIEAWVCLTGETQLIDFLVDMEQVTQF